MEDVKVCRICLIMDVEMQDLQSYPTNTYLEPLLAGSNLLDIANLQPYACCECTDLLKKFYFLKQKFIRSQTVLYELLDQDGKVSTSEIKHLDLDLSTDVSKYPEEKFSISNENEISSECIKQEIEEDNTHLSPAESVKEEDLYLGLDQNTDSSDDDEPLSLHKEKKTKIGEDGLESGVVEKIEPTECKKEPEPAPPPKRKRGRPKQNKVPKKKTSEKGKTPNGAPFRNSLYDLEEHITIFTLSLEDQIEEINKRKESTNYLNSPYQCNLCYKGFIDTHAWTHHVGKHSPAAGDIECVICKFRFKTKRMLQKHQSNHEKKYACKSCTHVSSNMTQAKQHQGWHKGVTYKCKHCDEIFTIWTSYMSHVRIKHPSEFICSICGYSYISKLGLTMHKTMMHKDIIAKGSSLSSEGPYCEECDVKFVSTEAYKRHMVMSTKHTRTNNTINGCRTCGETFKNEEELRLHHRKEHARKRPKNYGKKPTSGNFPAKCEHCPEVIPNGREHWTHYRRCHPDKEYPIQKNYVCDVCGKSFRGNAFLVYHKRTHTEERAYKCGQCDKAFYNRTNLQVHQKIHSDTRPYPCSVCFKAFKCKGALNRHFRSHTGHKPYSCEVCGKSFTQSNSRKLHVFTVHLKQPAPYVSRRRNTPHTPHTTRGKEEASNEHFVY